MKQNSITPSVVNQLIPITPSTINGEVVNTIDARELHVFLEVQTRFDKWFDRRVVEYGFLDGSDFCPILAESSGGRPRIEYVLTLDMGKELSMVERTSKGKEARLFFIEMEKRARAMALTNNPVMQTIAPELESTVKIAKLFGLEGNHALLSANTAIKNLHGIDCMATLEITGLIAESQVQYFTPSIIGKPLGLSAVKINKALENADFQIQRRGHKNRLVWEVTEKGKQHSQLIDTNKRHSDGSPIHQIKWASDVMDAVVGVK